MVSDGSALVAISTGLINSHMFRVCLLLPNVLAENILNVVDISSCRTYQDVRLWDCLSQVKAYFAHTNWLVVSNSFFHNIWDNPSHWLFFFKMVKTTNQPKRLNGMWTCTRILSDSVFTCWSIMPSSVPRNNTWPSWLVVWNMIFVVPFSWE